MKRRRSSGTWPPTNAHTFLLGALGRPVALPDGPSRAAHRRRGVRAGVVAPTPRRVVRLRPGRFASWGAGGLTRTAQRSNYTAVKLCVTRPGRLPGPRTHLTSARPPACPRPCGSPPVVSVARDSQ
jgi:hypothetical protein